MNEVFLIGKIITDVEFNFIINSKKKKSIARFNVETRDKQNINVVAYNETADSIYCNKKQNQYIFIEGKLRKNTVEILQYENIKF